MINGAITVPRMPDVWWTDVKNALSLISLSLIIKLFLLIIFENQGALPVLKWKLAGQDWRQTGKYHGDMDYTISA